MKKSYLFLVFVMSFIFMGSVFAEETKTARAYINSNCNIRTGPGTQNSKIASSYKGYYYNLVVDGTFKDTNNNKSCNSGVWYQVYYKGDPAYICGDHVDVVYSYANDDVAPSSDCEKAMSNAGFPSSYWGGLCNLKEKFPNWQFVALNTDADWSYSVERESSCGKSYLQTSKESYMDRSCTNQYGWSSSWKNASQTAVAFYMDPRNFLAERYIFQFEYLKYASGLEGFYPDSVRSIISSAAFYTYHKSIGNDLGDIINQAGKESDLSPTFMASRILQEMGTSDKLYNLYSGVYSDEYKDVYNFYNYGVSDECATSNGPTACGLSYAKEHNWIGLKEALKGGAGNISKSYINKGQYTTYLQKFNVTPTNVNSLYTHQYMTNIAAPSSESTSVYSSYKSQGILDQSFAFYIPVYKNMQATINNSNAGGTGNEGDTTVSSLPISTIVTSSGYKYETGYISGIEVGTDASTVRGTIESVVGSRQVIVFDSAGNVMNSGMLGTGCKIQITNSSSTETLEVIIKGDTSGDGVINALDLLQVQKSILNTYTLSGPYAKAGDTSKDGKVDALDLLQVQKQILNTYEIEQ